ncbi:hypothetical protein OGATHE_002335 [Ogataea polymorpha]|uniref:Uncharacterized protein n=1 Tax=Ogataea polymorpha TaxID=460523 RepID=A0A9P8PJK5_9ASCO|nr:hypothetical protein OGATHE_002335 [Ogataea polymorpha]
MSSKTGRFTLEDAKLPSLESSSKSPCLRIIASGKATFEFPNEASRESLLDNRPFLGVLSGVVKRLLDCDNNSPDNSPGPCFSVGSVASFAYKISNALL